MTLPAFTATLSIYRPIAHYAGRTIGHSQVVAILPSSSNPCMNSCAETCMTQGGEQNQCLQDCQSRCQLTAPAVEKGFA
jgi:hypothetical protein